MRDKTHCDNYIGQPEPSFKLNIGDCTLPVNGRFKPTKCHGVCPKYADMAYKMKQALVKSIK